MESRLTRAPSGACVSLSLFLFLCFFIGWWLVANQISAKRPQAKAEEATAAAASAAAVVDAVPAAAEKLYPCSVCSK